MAARGYVKNSIFTARDEDMIFSKRKNPGISSVSV